MPQSRYSALTLGKASWLAQHFKHAGRSDIRTSDRLIACMCEWLFMDSDDDVGTEPNATLMSALRTEHQIDARVDTCKDLGDTSYTTEITLSFGVVRVAVSSAQYYVPELALAVETEIQITSLV